MMSLIVWIGGATAGAQVDTVVVSDDIQPGMVIKATIGSASITYTVPAGASAAQVVTSFVSLWNDSAIPEFAEIEAEAVGDGSFTLTMQASSAGKPFIVAFIIGNGTNEKQMVTIGGNPTGGTFVLSSGGEVTDPIDHDATASTVEAKLEALTSVGVGNVTVDGDAGGPWTVEFIGTLAGTNVAPMGANPDNLTVAAETQEIDLGSPTGGTFTVQYGESGTPSAGIAYNASVATLKTALETLAEVAVDDIGVTGSAGGPYTLTFQGNFAGTDAESIIVNGTSLTGGLMGSVTITEQTAGGGGGNEVWTIREQYGDDAIAYLTGNSSVNGGTFDMTVTLTPDGGSAGDFITLTDIPYDVTVSEFQDLIDAETVAEGPRAVIVQASIGSQDAGSKLSDGDTWLIRFTTSLGNQTVGVGSFATGNLTGDVYTFSIPTPSIILPEIESRYASYWFLVINGEATESIPHNTTAADIIEKAEALSTVGAGNINVEFITTQNMISHGIRITFQNDLGNQDTELSVSMLVSSGYGFFIQPNWRGASGTSEVQRISIAGSPGSGKFSIKLGTGYSQTIDYNQSASELEDILEAVSTIGVGNVTCSGGPFPDTAIDVTFTGGLGGTNVALMVENQGAVETTQEGGAAATIDVATVQSTIDHTTTVANSGPNDFNTAANFDTGTVPVNGDSLLIPDGDNILYGLDQSDLTLVLLHFTAPDTQMGLPRRTDNDDIEYLDRFLKITAAEIIIDSNSELINIDVMDSSPAIEVLNSGSGQDGEHAVQIIGENSANTLTLLVLSGDVGVATGPKEAAYVKTITQRGGQLWIGQDVGLEDVERTGGLFHTDRTTIDGLITL